MHLSKLIIAHLALRLRLFSCVDLRDTQQLCFMFQLDGCVDVCICLVKGSMHHAT